MQSREQPEGADLTVLHNEPHLWPAIFASMPVLREKTVAGYAVWKSETLPKAYLPGLRLVRELWTASAFSTSAFRQGHDRARVLPHFRPDMRWAAVDERYLERKMLRLARRGRT